MRGTSNTSVGFTALIWDPLPSLLSLLPGEPWTSQPQPGATKLFFARPHPRIWSLLPATLKWPLPYLLRTLQFSLELACPPVGPLPLGYLG